MSILGLEAAPSSGHGFGHRAECLQVSNSLCTEMQQAPAVGWRSQGPGASCSAVTLDDLKFIYYSTYGASVWFYNLSPRVHSPRWGCRREEKRRCMGDISSQALTLLLLTTGTPPSCPDWFWGQAILPAKC